MVTLDEKLRNGRRLMRGLATTLVATALLPATYGLLNHRATTQRDDATLTEQDTPAERTMHQTERPQDTLDPSPGPEPLEEEPSTAYTLGGFAANGTRYAEHILNLQERGINAIPERTTREDGMALIRVVVPKDETVLPHLKEYAREHGASIAEITTVGDRIIDWDTLETAVRRSVATYNATVTADAAFPYQDIVERAITQLWPSDAVGAHKKKVAMAAATMEQESHFKSDVKPSKRGAIGLMQLMPYMVPRIQTRILNYDTARISPAQAAQPEHNITLGVALLKYNNGFCTELLGKPWDDQETLTCTFAGYNAGESAAKRFMATRTTNRETRAYVPSVHAKMERHMQNMR